MLYCVGDVFAVIALTINDENLNYYLMRCIEQKMKLLENYDYHGFTYDIGFIILKGYFLREANESGDFFYFQYYEPDVIICQYSHLVCATNINLIEV